MEAFIAKAISYGWVLAGVLFWRLWDKQDKKLEELSKRHNEFVTETEAKEMIRVIVEPIVSDQKELKSDIKNIIALLNEIQKELAYSAGLRESEKAIDKEKGK